VKESALVFYMVVLWEMYEPDHKKARKQEYPRVVIDNAIYLVAGCSKALWGIQSNFNKSELLTI